MKRKRRRTTTTIEPFPPTSGIDGVRVTFVLLAASLLIANVAAGQSALTLERCLALARERNAQLRISEASVRSANLTLAEFQAGTKPQVSLKSGASYAPTTPSFGYDPVVSNQGELSAQLVVEHTLYDGGVRGLRSDRLRLDVERTDLQRRAAQRDLVFSVEASFVEALRSGREVDLQQEGVDQLADYLSLVERLAGGGAGSSTDVLKTRVQLADARIALQSARAAAADSKLALAELIGLPVDTSFSVQGSIDSLITIPIDTSGAPTPDVGQTLDAQIASLGIEQSSLDVEMARRERYPSVGLFGDAGLLTSVENLRLPGLERLPIAGYQVGFSLDLPVLNWGGTGLRVEEREVAADTLRYQSVLLERSLQREIRRTAVRLAAARDRLSMIRNSLTAAEDNYLLTKSKYVGGSTPALEVLIAQQLLTERRLAELQTLAEIQDLAADIQRLGSR